MLTQHERLSCLGHADRDQMLSPFKRLTDCWNSGVCVSKRAALARLHWMDGLVILPQYDACRTEALLRV